jgi:hypothetical protein
MVHWEQPGACAAEILLHTARSEQQKPPGPRA